MPQKEDKTLYARKRSTITKHQSLFTNHLSRLPSSLSLLLAGRFRFFGRWFLVQLFINGRLFGKSGFLSRAGVQPGAAGLSVVARFV